jgi:hypothetical protein
MQRIDIFIEVPDDLAQLQLPKALDRRMQALLAQQNGGIPLSDDERAEAEALAQVVDLLDWLRLRMIETAEPAPDPDIQGGPCTNLDAFFDGELTADEGKSFCLHLVSCRRCQAVLQGRIHEQVILALDPETHRRDD